MAVSTIDVANLALIDLSSQNGHGAQDATIFLFLRLQQHSSNHLHMYHAQHSRETTEASVKQGELRRRSQPVSVMTVGGRTVRRCCGGTVASQEPCRPVPVRCSSHRSAGVAPPVRWCPCPIGLPRAYLSGYAGTFLDNVAT